MVTEPGPLPTRRSSGLLMHITSLPGRLGIGDLGPQARFFAERLAGPASGTGRSSGGTDRVRQLALLLSVQLRRQPAADSFDLLLDSGLIDPDDRDEVAITRDDRVDYGRSTPRSWAFLRRQQDPFCGRRIRLG